MRRITTFFSNFLIAAPLLIALNATAQKTETPTDAWLMPGVSVQMSSKFRLLGQLGFNTRQPMNYIYSQVFFTVNKYLTLSAGHSFFQSKGINSFDQHDIIAAATVAKSLGRFTLENRNMFRMIMASHNPSAYVYRNRLRAMYGFSFLSRKGSVYAIDEVFYAISKGHWSRNRIGMGVSFDVINKVNLDVTYLKQNGAVSGRVNLVFVQMTMNLSVLKSND